MRRIMAVGLSLGLLLAGPSATSAGEPKQSETGTVVLPTPHPQAPAECFAGYHRRANYFAQEQLNSVVGHHFNVDEATWGGKFVLEPTGGQGTIDLDIVFFVDFKTDPADPTGGPLSATIANRAAGGEKGIVPEGMTKAVVCLWSGDQYQGAAATFSYDAFTPAKKKK
ncbi:MAG TPA: hypothetical protein VNC78_02135 [Actinomycetota bacterium]|nr:hypothetical protein [Actinomycetota bacterium]